jgi:phosphoglycerate dehydrogenase-like enzyme
MSAGTTSSSCRSTTSCRGQRSSLNLPLTPTTVRLLDAAKIATLPPGVTIVNTARGGVVDEEALLAALESGAVRAAGLDVFATERETPNPKLVAHPNVISTPHSAAFSEEALTELSRSAAEGRRPRALGRSCRTSLSRLRIRLPAGYEEVTGE